MKNKTYSKLIGILIFGFMMFTSCSSDDDGNAPVDSSFTDKWWFDSNNFAADVYFDSNGDFEQFIDFGGFQNTSTGDWAWEDQDAGVIKITNYMGGGQALGEVFLKISDLEDSTMTLQQSIDGVDYSIEVFYVDVEPEDE